MSKDTSYNGWTNWLTWNIYCNYTSDERTYNYVLDLAEQAKDSDYLASMLRNEYTESLLASVIDNGTLGSTLAIDAIEKSAESINWQEIAHAFIEDN